jgi:hypothetical protein
MKLESHHADSFLFVHDGIVANAQKARLDMPERGGLGNSLSENAGLIEGQHACWIVNEN